MNDPGERFWSKVDKNAPGGCWLWTGPTSRQGYGVFSWSVGRNQFRFAHRITYLLASGPIPEGMELDHGPGCHNPACVNPAHLRLATRAENNRNRGRHKDNTSGYKGVSWNKRAGRWEASICVNRKIHHLGLFPSAEDAYGAYCAAAARLHGEFANLGGGAS